LKPKVKKLMLWLLVNTVVLMVVYFWLPSQLEFAFIPLIYAVAGTALLLYFVIYNGGFVAKNATVDMLPDTMTAEEKEAHLARARERLEKSKWVLTVLIPIVLVFAVDMIYIYLIPMLFGGSK